MPLSNIREQNRPLLIFFIFTLFVTSILRLAYGIFIIDPLSGPDSSTYFDARNDLSKNGVFGAARGIPFWPIGYPWFLHFISLFFGENLLWVSIIQSLIWSLAILLFTKFLFVYVNPPIAYLTGILLSLNPALSGASVQLMYEVPQLSLIMIGVYCVTKNSKNFQILSIYRLLSVLVFTLAICMQPKAVVVISCILIIFLSKRKRSFEKSLVVILSLILGYLSLLLRNIIAGDGPIVSSNFSIHVLAGIQQVDSDFLLTCDSNDRSDSIKLITCLQFSKFRDIPFGFEVTLNNLLDITAPYIGNFGNGMQIGSTGTWWHAFDFRRLLEFYEFWNHETLYWYVDRGLSIVWTICLVLLIIDGFRTLNLGHKSLSVLTSRFLIAATCTLTIIPALGFGDSRYRLGIIPFYTVFIATSLLRLSLKLAPLKDSEFHLSSKGD